ncbi:MAG: AurF N-oxygenase family protein [Polyangia bacterium]
MTEPEIPVEEARSTRESYEALLARLSRQSVQKRYECYRDIDWDAPEFQIDPVDPRWELPPTDPLGGTAWYRALPQPERARLGLFRLATFMKVGLQFENVLSQGLLRFALTRGVHSPEQRYAYHELIEESHHSMMFAEFVRRSGLAVPGLARMWLHLDRLVVWLGDRFPELFFVFVLGGEDPIDHAQRLQLAQRENMHPLVKRMSQIHITEEARHLCFARSYLREHVPALSPRKRAVLAVAAPTILRLMSELMLKPSPALVREFAIPRPVVDEAFTNNAAFRALTLESLRKVRELMDELGLVTGRTTPLWRALGAAA